MLLVVGGQFERRYITLQDQDAQHAPGTFVVTCTSCGQKYKVDESFYGKHIRCTKCKHGFSVREDVRQWRSVIADAAARYGDYDDGDDTAS